MYFYLPKLEAYREARLWSDVFRAVSEVISDIRNFTFNLIRLKPTSKCRLERFGALH